MTEVTDKEKFITIDTGRCPRCKARVHLIPSKSHLKEQPAHIKCDEFENECSFKWENVSDNIQKLILNSIYKISRRQIQDRLGQLKWATSKPELNLSQIQQEMVSISNALGERYRPAIYIEVM